MSEYMERHEVAKMIGAPPGYVGYGEGGQLTEKVRRHPYSVVLLDEIEKAHADVFNILLQVMEEGQLTDSYGRRVDFRNSVLIMTSNVGATEVKSGKTLGFVQDEASNQSAIKSKLLDQLKKTFNPEFLNRLDDAIVFRQLNREDMAQIVDILLGDFIKRIEVLEMSIDFSDESRRFLMERGFDPAHGARPLKRAIQRYLEDPMSELLLQQGITREAEVHVTTEKDGENLKFALTARSRSKEDPSPETA